LTLETVAGQGAFGAAERPDRRSRERLMGNTDIGEVSSTKRQRSGAPTKRVGRHDRLGANETSVSCY